MLLPPFTVRAIPPLVGRKPRILLPKDFVRTVDDYPGLARNGNAILAGGCPTVFMDRASLVGGHRWYLGTSHATEILRVPPIFPPYLVHGRVGGSCLGPNRRCYLEGN